MSGKVPSKAANGLRTYVHYNAGVGEDEVERLRDVAFAGELVPYCTAILDNVLVDAEANKREIRAACGRPGIDWDEIGPSLRRVIAWNIRASWAEAEADAA